LYSVYDNNNNNNNNNNNIYTYYNYMPTTDYYMSLWMS